MKRTLFLLAALLVFAAAGHALLIEGYDPAVNDRFSSGYPLVPVPNDHVQFVGRGLDWSGVGWWRKDPQYSVSLLSSRHFTYTKHMGPLIGDSITFQGRDGQLHDYHVAKLQLVQIGKAGNEPLYADAGVGTFTETVALGDMVSHYPVAVSKSGFQAFLGRKILTYGHPARIGTNEIVEGLMLPGIGSEYNFHTTGLTAGMGKVEVGDSGSPSFIVLGGKLALVGAHWKDNTDCMISGLVEGMSAIMAQDGSRLETAPLDH